MIKSVTTPRDNVTQNDDRNGIVEEIPMQNAIKSVIEVTVIEAPASCLLC